MGKKPRKHSAEFKFRAVLESVRKGAVADVVRWYNINANQLTMWRKQFLESGAQIFKKALSKEAVRYRKCIAQLENLIG